MGIEIREYLSKIAAKFKQMLLIETRVSLSIDEKTTLKISCYSPSKSGKIPLYKSNFCIILLFLSVVPGQDTVLNTFSFM